MLYKANDQSIEYPHIFLTRVEFVLVTETDQSLDYTHILPARIKVALKVTHSRC